MFQTEHPEYCLLVFGADASTRVWLVQDGDVLYVDRNHNGDLTKADERIAAEPDYGDPKNGIYRFNVGSIVDGARTHKHLTVTTSDQSFQIASDEQVRKLLEANPR